MRLAAGSRLGPFEIVSPLGAGGMGEVYRARDTRLGREVAVKVLPQHLLANPDVHTRFEREARTISSLNHPHICTLHDIGREGDIEYLVMELVDGETLAQRLEKGALPMSEVLRLGTQIADALDRAHRAGIVHRDFKPGNVMLTRSGAKLMDFGLARSTGMTGTAGGSGVTLAALTQSPTIASPLTAEGTLVGTFLYMAPEQLEGKEADSRSDLWAFGCVLYEMATGRRAFEGRSQASLIGAIMNSDPPFMMVAQPTLPPALDALVRACLAKDPEERVQTAHDVKLQLSWIGASSTSTGAAAPALPKRAPSREPIAWAVAGLAIVAAAILGWRGANPKPPDALQLRFHVPVPEALRAVDIPRISPDGRLLAFSGQDSTGRTMIWVRSLNSLNSNPLPGTEDAGRPFWSPDSRHLAFMSRGKLKKIPAAGGPPEVICDAPGGADGTWGREGVILFDGADVDPIRQVKASGGIATTAMVADSGALAGWPTFLPDGKHYFYTLIRPKGSEILVAALGDKKGKSLGLNGSRVEYSPDGYLVFARDRTLLAQRFNARSLKVEGEPFPVAEDLPVSASAQANFAVSENGVLVYRSTASIDSRFVWLDRTGREIGGVGVVADYRAPALSPDGSRIAVRRRELEGSNLDIWVLEPARGTTTRFTFDPADDTSPIWSPDGSKIAWASSRGGTESIWIKSASGLGPEEQLKTTGTALTPLDWSADGSHLLYSAFDPGTLVDIFSIPTTGERKPEALLQSTFVEQRAHLSPDSRWIVYESQESGRPEVYVASFRGTAGKWQISTNGGSEPFWSRDGREIWYLSADQRLMSVLVTPGAELNPSTPTALFPIRVEGGRRRNVYCPSPDGKRFLFQLPEGETSTPMTVVVNWRAGIARP